MPKWVRRLLTEIASWFFEDASWRHHDFGYVVGGARCDWKFFAAMTKDAVSQPCKWLVAHVLVALLISVVFYVAVRIFGQFGSFKYRDYYTTLREILNAY